ncbi:MAG: PKD domain-containing protein, partial [Acidobacteriota bacterium]
MRSCIATLLVWGVLLVQPLLSTPQQTSAPEKKHTSRADGGSHLITVVGHATQFEGHGISPDGQPLRYEWDFDGDGIADYQSTDSGSATWTYKKPGKYTAVFRAFGEDG